MTGPMPWSPDRVAGRVEFDDVTFNYDGRHPAVADLSFTARPGEMVALVGRDRRRQVDRACFAASRFRSAIGRITIDGTDIRDIKLAALRRNIGVVFQESLLFNRSIAENLLVGKPDATEEQMRDAAARRPGARFHRIQSRRLSTPKSASADARCRAANANGCRLRARC